jgi:hypothetical protein
MQPMSVRTAALSHRSVKPAPRNGIFAAAKMTHLSDDKTVAKMGHPIVGSVVRRGPPVRQTPLRMTPQICNELIGHHTKTTMLLL